jgi:hypothetical protein
VIRQAVERGLRGHLERDGGLSHEGHDAHHSRK